MAQVSIRISFLAFEIDLTNEQRARKTVAVSSVEQPHARPERTPRVETSMTSKPDWIEHVSVTLGREPAKMCSIHDTAVGQFPLTEKQTT